MEHINIEIKARSDRHREIRALLLSEKAEFKGEDHQTDTYFKISSGRLKLREGNIENSLIHYRRENKKGPKQSCVMLYKTRPESGLKEILTAALGIWKVVDKKREIYFIGNIKFHLDTVKHLGTFVEIEAIDKDGSIGIDKLRKQCETYCHRFQLAEKDLVEKSYSDLIPAENESC